ncbi:hypothetical protein PM8797T_22973 [Gimesia maris DSM 8797]|uniref:Uncharacterized protein n=2 Tax=Gimesia maris TaxID=122 RepID=A0ABX5YRU3_9PLAN|nr:hypothetical protein PM8797T_22973 [Gimesia maris DSM 8797]QEG18293.1 hypothetical protein GmarT_41790 [Gimesia maris]
MLVYGFSGGFIGVVVGYVLAYTVPAVTNVLTSLLIAVGVNPRCEALLGLAVLGSLFFAIGFISGTVVSCFQSDKPV